MGSVYHVSIGESTPFRRQKTAIRVDECLISKGFKSSESLFTNLVNSRRNSASAMPEPKRFE